MKILVVDDDEAVRTSLSCVLLSEGFDVCLAAGGEEAVNELARHTIDLVLVDMNMPVQNGWGTIATLRAIKPSIPVIIITARPDQLRTARAAGIDLMEKPLDLPTLVNRISALLNSRPTPAASTKV